MNIYITSKTFTHPFVIHPHSSYIWTFILNILFYSTNLFVYVFSSVAQSCLTLWDPMDCSTPGLPVHHQLPVFTQTHAHWCHPTISFSIISFSSCLQSFPASGSFPMSQFFPSGGQNIGVSASASVLPMTIQDWFPLGWTGSISLLSKGLSRVFFNTTDQKHQFFGAQLSLWSNCHIHDHWKNHSFD